MTFDIEVGEVMRERIRFSFNQLLGRTVIRCQGRELQRQVRWFSEPVTDTFFIELSEQEKVQVRIEKRRKHLLASKYYVYVNDRLAECFEGV
jgi:hypothetical protein